MAPFWIRFTPVMFYHVSDITSHSNYKHKDGIVAKGEDKKVDMNTRNPTLERYVDRHIDWRIRKPTPFISVYTRKEDAEEEAGRRVKEGVEDVMIWTIDTRKRRPREWIEYRNLRGLVEWLELRIEDDGPHDIKYEYVFNRCIPKSIIARKKRMN